MGLHLTPPLPPPLLQVLWAQLMSDPRSFISACHHEGWDNDSKWWVGAEEEGEGAGMEFLVSGGSRCHGHTLLGPIKQDTERRAPLLAHGKHLLHSQ